MNHIKYIVSAIKEGELLFLDTRRDCAGRTPCWVTVYERRFGSRGEAKSAAERALKQDPHLSNVMIHPVRTGNDIW